MFGNDDTSAWYDTPTVWEMINVQFYLESV